jgi:hypothetical protein
MRHNAPPSIEEVLRRPVETAPRIVHVKVSHSAASRARARFPDRSKPEVLT